MKQDNPESMTLTTFSEAAIVGFVFALEDAVLTGKIDADTAMEIRQKANEFYNALLAGSQIVKSDGKVSVKEPEPMRDSVDIDPNTGDE